MKKVPKKHDYPWGYEINWAQSDIHTSKILHIRTQQQYHWSHNPDKFEAVHCLFGSLLIHTAAGDDKIWPGETVILTAEVLAIKAGHEAAEVLFTSTNV